jgi:hypothetical protein
MCQHVVGIALLIHRDRDAVDEDGTDARRAFALGPDGGALAAADLSPSQALVLHHRLARGAYARRPR